MLIALMIITAIAAGYCFGRAHAAGRSVPEAAKTDERGRTTRPVKTDEYGRTFDERMTAARQAAADLDRTLDHHESAFDRHGDAIQDLVSSYSHINIQLDEQRKLMEETRAMLQEHEDRMCIRVSKLAALQVSPE